MNKTIRFFLFAFILFNYIYPSLNLFAQESGLQLFTENRCSRCHTIGRGRFVGPDLYGIAEKRGKDEIVKWIVNPELIYESSGKKPYNESYPPMPALNVSEKDAGKIADFLIQNDIQKSSPDSGVIKGRVFNNTDGKGMEGVDVYLSSYIGDRKTGEDLFISEGDGAFKFTDLSWTNSYSLGIKNEGIEYETAKTVFPPDKDSIELQLPLYESTESDENIALNLNHLVFSIDGNYMSVAEIYEFENRGEKIYTGIKQGDNRFKSLRFNIPVEAEEFNLLQGLDSKDFIKQGDMAYGSTVFMPGSKRVVFSYRVPLSIGKNIIERKVVYNSATILILSPEKQNNIEVLGLKQLEPVNVGGDSYLRWLGQEIAAGTEIKILYSNLSLSIIPKDVYPVAIFAVIFIAMVLIGIVRNKFT